MKNTDENQKTKHIQRLLPLGRSTDGFTCMCGMYCFMCGNDRSLYNPSLVEFFRIIKKLGRCIK